MSAVRAVAAATGRPGDRGGGAAGLGTDDASPQAAAANSRYPVDAQHEEMS